jgi:hypothetical protein
MAFLLAAGALLAIGLVGGRVWFSRDIEGGDQIGM